MNKMPVCISRGSFYSMIFQEIISSYALKNAQFNDSPYIYATRNVIRIKK